MPEIFEFLNPQKHILQGMCISWKWKWYWKLEIGNGCQTF